MAMTISAILAVILVTMQGGKPIRLPLPQHTYGDRAAAERATQAYRDAWMSNDADRVMATLAPDAVIYPSNLPPIAGAAAIKQFWFPTSGPSTRVTQMDLDIDSVAVDGDTAIVSGRGSLTFVVTANGVAAPARTQHSWHVNVLRRQPDGRWLIWRRMWGDVHPPS